MPKLASLGIEKRKLCNLLLPSGRITASDPLTLSSNGLPLTHTVEPGTYPASFYLVKSEEWGNRVGLAELQFSEAEVRCWTPALVEGQQLENLEDDGYFGYAVDAGLGSFMSVEAYAELDAAMTRAERNIAGYTDYYSNVLACQFEGLDVDVVEHFPRKDCNLSIAIFHSGFGDGVYPSYFGFDKRNQAVRLVTTFFVFEELISKSSQGKQP